LLGLAVNDRSRSSEKTPKEPAATVIGGAQPERIGGFIGPYKLLQQIGEGGFGIVYMAEQAKPVRRVVALKIIKPGMDSAQVIARFETERQALALMDHPNVAKVLDAGATQSGHPYFVMELVKGVPITEFCDKHHMPPEERLTLFLDVCHAIQHAHQKGVIHRDIKPSNVMVTIHDGAPVVKVIDFGVAKATAQKLTERTLFTAYGQMVGTPAYMSPEQAEMSGLDVDTRTDVYSLGVLLYELLTGTTPLELERLRQAGYAEMQRVIREEETPRPSTRLSSRKDSATIQAGYRGLDWKRLVKLLSGDLDWIVMKSLEKDRNRRYSTPGDFAEDVERYLHREAIAARPPSTAYRMKKFAQRNRVAVLTSVIVAIALLAGSTVATWEAIRATGAEHRALAALEDAERARAAESAQRQRAEADEQKALAAAAAERQANEVARQNELKAAQQRDLAKARFRLAREAVDQYHTRVSESPELKAKGLEKLRTELLQAAAGFYDKFLQDASDDPDVRAERGRAFRRLADLYADTGRLPQADQACEESSKIFARLSADFPKDARYKRELALTHLSAGKLHNLGGRPDRARNSLHAAINILKPLVIAYPNVSEYQADLAETFDELGAFAVDERDQVWGEGTALARRLVAASGADRRHRLLLANLLTNMGFARQDRNSEAIPWYEEALPVARGLTEADPDDPEARQILSQVTNNLAMAYQRSGKLDRSAALWQESLALARRNATQHPLVPQLQYALLIAYNNAAIFYRNAKHDPATAQKTYEEGVAFLKQLISTQPQIVDSGIRYQAIYLLNGLAVSRSQSDRLAEAATAWTEALAFLKQEGEQSPTFVFDEHRLDSLYGKLQKLLRKSHQDDLADAAVSEEVDYVVKLAEKYPECEPARSWLLGSANRVFHEVRGKEAQARLFGQLNAAWERALSRTQSKEETGSSQALARSQELAGLYLSVAAQQAWSHRDTGYAQTGQRALGLARPSDDPTTLERAAKACVLQAGGDAASLAEALTLARKAVEVGRGHGYFPYFQMSLGMCEFRNGHWAASDAVLLAAMKTQADASQLWLTSAFYRAMTLFRQGKSAEARKLATEAASKMKPLPQDEDAVFEQNDLIVWMAYKEAKELLESKPTSPQPARRVGE
jgi:eukaryotic-like serine/threonine-protein kinase